MFEVGGVLFARAWLELTTTVFDCPAVFAVELLAVVFPALLQAEKSKANETTHNVKRAVRVRIFIFSFQKLNFLSVDMKLKEQDECTFNVELQSRCFTSFDNTGY